MLWNKEEKFAAIPYENEAAIEQAVNEVKDALFGTTRISIPEGQIEAALLGAQAQPGLLISIPEGQIESILRGV